MTNEEIISLLKSIDGEDLHDNNGMLTDMFTEFSKAGLYFVTYKDLQNVVVVSSKVEYILFDLDEDMNYDIVVIKAKDKLHFSIDLDNDLDPERGEVLHYAKKAHLNLIKVVQDYDNVTLIPTFEAIEFNILRGGKESPALLFSKDAII